MIQNASHTHSSSFIVPVGHPAIPGHFPGNPLVPGVVIVDRVMEAAEDWLNRQLYVASIAQAKFVAPLRPAERADITLTLKNSMLGYEVRRDHELIAKGTLRLRGVVVT